MVIIKSLSGGSCNPLRILNFILGATDKHLVCVTIVSEVLERKKNSILNEQQVQ